MELCRGCGIITVGKCKIKTPTPINGATQEEQMALNAMTLNVVMALIALSIPALVFAGCIMTRKKKTMPEVSEAAPHFELDRAA